MTLNAPLGLDILRINDSHTLTVGSGGLALSVSGNEILIGSSTGTAGLFLNGASSIASGTSIILNGSANDTLGGSNTLTNNGNINGGGKLDVLITDIGTITA